MAAHADSQFAELIGADLVKLMESEDALATIKVVQNAVAKLQLNET